MRDGQEPSGSGADVGQEPSALSDANLEAGVAHGRGGRLWLVLVGVVAVVIAVMVATLMMTGAPSRELRPSASPAVPAVRPAPYERPTGLQFVDPKHGYLFYGWNSSVYKQCPYLQVTNDGRTWSEPRRPRDLDCFRASDSHAGNLPWVVATDVNTVVIHWYGQSFLSHDQGRTWRAYQASRRSATTVPETAALSLDCPESPCAARLMWVDPATGDMMVVDGPPGMWEPDSQLYRAGDGSIWMTGWTADGRLQTAVTRDGGGTWQTSILDATNEPEWSSMDVVSADGRTGYTMVYDPGVESNDARLIEPSDYRIFQTRDGGRTWHLTRDGRAGEFSFTTGALLLTDGSLLLHEIKGLRPADGWYATRDGGKTLRRVTWMPRESFAFPKRFAGGWLIFTNTLGVPPRLWLTDDGRRWREVPMPRA